MLEDYLGAAWQFLDTVKCHLGENYLSYTTVEVSQFCSLEIVPISTTTSLDLSKLVPIDS